MKATNGFNPRAREGRDLSHHRAAAAATSFNPRAREGRDKLTEVLAKHGRVSIHAPARGATLEHITARAVQKFQSTRPRGARRRRPARSATRRCFNPRAREGRDAPKSVAVSARRSFNPRAREGRDISGVPSATVSAVSIHAPARGATHGERADVAAGHVSIHAPARGATQRPTLRDTPSRFQSTRPRGARRTPSSSRRARARFNPRAREGRDSAASRLSMTSAVSIHAPARGATFFPREVTLSARVSIHAPARGATCAATERRGGTHGFNPRAREGRDDHVLAAEK